MKILSFKEYGTSLKATIQSSGKLGFSQGTSNALRLNEKEAVVFAQDEERPKVLYLSVLDHQTEDSFDLHCSGGYYNVNTKALFDILEIEYKKRTVIFDLTRDKSKDEEMGGNVYRMDPRILTKKPKEETLESED